MPKRLQTCQWIVNFESIEISLTNWSNISQTYMTKTKIIFVTGLQSPIKCYAKALKPYTLGKIYSTVLTFETKKVALATEKKFSIDASCKNSGKKFVNWKRSQKISRLEGEGNI